MDPDPVLRVGQPPMPTPSTSCGLRGKASAAEPDREHVTATKDENMKQGCDGWSFRDRLVCKKLQIDVWAKIYWVMPCSFQSIKQIHPGVVGRMEELSRKRSWMVPMASTWTTTGCAWPVLPPTAVLMSVAHAAAHRGLVHTLHPWSYCGVHSRCDTCYHWRSCGCLGIFGSVFLLDLWKPRAVLLPKALWTAPWSRIESHGPRCRVEAFRGEWPVWPPETILNMLLSMVHAATLNHGPAAAWGWVDNCHPCYYQKPCGYPLSVPLKPC